MVGALGAIGLLAGWFDIVQRRLPNWLCLVALLVGLGFTWAVQGGGSVPWHLLHAGVALVVGMGLFAIRAVGGGDAKFYAGVASWFALGEGLRLLATVSLAGLVVLAGWAIQRKLSGKKVFDRQASDADKLPFGVAIAAGATLTLAWSRLW
jgi:prepilin peptidase CpaA